jgi:hypothetical protein
LYAINFRAKKDYTVPKNLSNMIGLKCESPGSACVRGRGWVGAIPHDDGYRVMIATLMTVTAARISMLTRTAEPSVVLSNLFEFFTTTFLSPSGDRLFPSELSEFWI